MRALLLGIAVVALLPIAAAAGDTACEVRDAPSLNFEEVHKGVEALSGRVTACGSAHPALLVRISLADASLVLSVQADPDHGTRSLQDYLRVEPRARAVISGGFLKSFYPPLPSGLVKRGGQVVNAGRATDILDGVLCFGPQGKTVHVERMSPGAVAEYPDCLQTGPLLVTSGTRVPGVSSRLPPGFVAATRRAFVAVLPDDEVVLGILDEARLEDVAELAARSEEKGGLGADAAINLSGGWPSGIAVAKGPSTGDLEALLPNAIVAVER